MVNARQLLSEAKGELELAGERFGRVGDEEEQARELLEYAVGHDPGEWEEIGSAAARRFHRLIKRRLTGEPVELILGWVEFCGLRMSVKPGVFIPRLTSEFLASQAIRRLRRRRRPVFLDVAAGVGPVAIATARAVPHASVWALDISRRALAQGRANAAKLHVGNITFLASDLFAAVPGDLLGHVDVISGHLPYVARADLAGLPEEIKAFEPRDTLSDGSRDGLGLVRRVVREGYFWLKPGGWLLIEIMPSESRRVRTLLSSSGFTDIRSTRGSLKQTRVIVGHKP